MKKYGFLAAAALIAAVSCAQKAEVIIYGGTSAAVTAAYSAAAEGCNVTIVCPDEVLGGMTTGGLGQTDIGNKQAVIGIARDFYRKVGAHYGNLEQWIFEPHVASEILDGYLDNRRITVEKGWYIDSVRMDGTRISSIFCHSKEGMPKEFKGNQFIDASYEGDLMARAGVSYRVGREDNGEYGETYNGSELRGLHQFPDGIDPFVIPGKPESGLLWGISDARLKADGTGDTLVQAYNYRICLTDVPENMIPIGRPEGYDSTRYELAIRVLETIEKPQLRDFFIWSPMPCHKTDINNYGPFSTDMIGMNHSYPEATHEERAEIIKAHREYNLGLLYFLGNDPRVPESLRSEITRWGLPKDEYPTTGHWSHQLYLRECRRMVGEYVASQADCEGKTTIEDGIGYAAYGMDSHNCERTVIEKDGKYMVKNEGDVQIGVGCPYPISYRSITPKREECTNLLVPVCLSATHIAYGSIRMEPVFMGLGEVAGLAAARAGRRGAVQQVDVESIQKTLAEDPYLNGTAPDVLIDENSEYISVGEGWELRYGYGSYGASLYRYVGEPGKSTFTYNIPEDLDGTYAIYTYKQKWGAPTTEYHVTIDGLKSYIHFDRDSFVVSGQTWGDWMYLGTFNLTKGHGGTVRPICEEQDMLTDALLLVKTEGYPRFKDQRLSREYRPRRLAGKICRSCSIDRRNVFLSGMSNGGEGKNEVLLYDVTGGGHEWDEDAFDVHSAIFDFFDRHLN